MSKNDNCLGIYFNDNYVKYAKVLKNSSGLLELKEHGIKFVKSTLKETIYTIITETNSTDIPVAINAPSIKYVPFQVFKQISAPDMVNAIKLEFDDWCEKNSVMPDKYSFVYYLSDVSIGDYRKGIMAICEKSQIEEMSTISDIKIGAIYPAEILSRFIVPKDDKNFILVNLDDKLAVTTVINSKITSISEYDSGMNSIFERFEDILGSYQKAYDACKQINVFTDEVNSLNKVQLEEILEPILQGVLSKILEDVNKVKTDINKIILTGSGTLFTNIDTLFSEFFGLKCEILKPDIISDPGGVRNIADMIEVNPAITLASEFIIPSTKGMEFLKKNITTGDVFKKIIESFKNKKTEIKPVSSTFNISILDNILKYSMYPLVVIMVVIVSYFIFSNIYVNQVNGLKALAENKANEYAAEKSKIDADKSTIQTSTASYKEINDKIDNLKSQIESNQIGKYSTYNVAAFMQKLVQVIPRNVKLISISSDDNKKVIIKAEADEYPAIGYFVATLRLHEDILTGIEIKKIDNSTKVTVEIGGELP